MTINLRDVTVKYGTETALDSVSPHFEGNVPYTILGKSGCGKTTLLYVLAALKEPSSGMITFDGEALTRGRAGTSIVLQGCGLLPWKTVLGNLMFILKSKGMPDRIPGAVELLRSLGLYEQRDKYPNDLSGGQRQRAAIACAIAPRPDLLLLDEPTSALDSFTKESIQNLLLQIQHDSTRPMSSVIVTHDIEEAVFLGQKVVVMKKAGVKRIFDNPFYAAVGAREELGFYQYCLAIRKCLREEDT